MLQKFLRLSQAKRNINNLNRMKNHLKAHGYEVQEQSAHHYLLVPLKSVAHGLNNTVLSISSSHGDEQSSEHQNRYKISLGQEPNLTSINTSPSIPATTGRSSPYYMPSEIETSLSAP